MASTVKVNPTCHAGFIGTCDLSIFDKCITDNPQMDITVVTEESNSTTRTYRMKLLNPTVTDGTLKLYVASDPKDLDEVPCNVLVIYISDSEPYYGLELETEQKWTDHIRSIHGNDHRISTVYVQFTATNLSKCTVKDRITYLCAKDPMRIITKIWREHLAISNYGPVLSNPRSDKLATVRVNIARFDESYDVPTILTHVVADNKYDVYEVPANVSRENRTHVYELGTVNGQITMTFTEDTDSDLRVKYDVLMVVVSRHGMISEQFKRYMDTECDVASAHSVFICTMPDDNCTDPECVIKCTEHIDMAFNKFVRRFCNVDGVVQLAINKQTHWNPPLLHRIIQHYVNDGDYQDSIMCSFKY